jgi:D-sedoheptulose 7-phosphate isomerase
MKRRTREKHPLEHEARGWLKEAAATLRRTEARCSAAVAEAAEAILQCLETGGTVYLCGNGGSAADAQHLAAEFAGRFQLERGALSAVALTTNTSALTAIGNDYGYEHVFARQLEGLGTPGDVLIAISTSGGAPSVHRAVATATRLGLTTIAMTGSKGRAFADSCDVALVTPHAATSHIQEGHIAMGHALCLMVERALFGERAAAGGAGRPARRARGSSRRPARARRAGRAGARRPR